MFGTDTGYARGTLLLYTLVGIAHRQHYLAASVSIYWGLGGSPEQHSMQISDMNLAFVESDSILDPITPPSSMPAIRKSNSLSFHPVCHEAAPWALGLGLEIGLDFYFAFCILGSGMVRV